jgi:hypothetical protein
MNNEAINNLIGQRITSIVNGPDSVTIETEAKRTFRFYHLQDCCENVDLYATCGTPAKILHRLTVTAAYLFESQEPPACLLPEMHKKGYESWTWTDVVVECGPFVTHFVFFGESNGFYSESIYCSES